MRLTLFKELERELECPDFKTADKIAAGLIIHEQSFMRLLVTADFPFWLAGQVKFNFD